MPTAADATSIGRSRRKGSLARLMGIWIAIFVTLLPIRDIRAGQRHSLPALRIAIEAAPRPRSIRRSTAGLAPCSLNQIHRAGFAAAWPSARPLYKPRWDEARLLFLPDGHFRSRRSAPA